MNNAREVANLSGASAPPQETIRVQGHADRWWRPCKYYVRAHLGAICLSGWFAYLDATAPSGTAMRVAMYVAAPAIALFFVAPLLTLSLGVLSLWRGRKYFALALWDAVLCLIHLVVLFPAYS